MFYHCACSESTRAIFIWTLNYFSFCQANMQLGPGAAVCSYPGIMSANIKAKYLPLLNSWYKTRMCWYASWRWLFWALFKLLILHCGCRFNIRTILPITHTGVNKDTSCLIFPSLLTKAVFLGVPWEWRNTPRALSNWSAVPAGCRWWPVDHHHLNPAS